MKKLILITILIVASTVVNAQKMITRGGEIKFEASMPSFEEIAATNVTSSCIFDLDTGEFVSLALIKGFKFKIPLMEEHFNENYMESTKFPKATFKGNVLNFNKSKLSATKTAYDLEGELTIHGVTKKIKTKIYLTQTGSKVIATSGFSVKPADYNIDIPKLVRSKIAETVKINLNFTLEEKK
jgi:hypothetical protein